MSKRTEQILKNSGLSRTETRFKILDLFLASDKALSLAQIEASFEKLDRITLYRNLRTFESKGIIHRAVDGTNHPKYALCDEHCQAHSHQDNHPHFHCTVCEKTICLEDLVTPNLPKLPPGYQVVESNLILSGLCTDCTA